MENLPILNSIPPRTGNIPAGASAADAASSDLQDGASGFDAALQRELARENAPASPTAAAGKDSDSAAPEATVALPDAGQIALEIGNLVAILLTAPAARPMPGQSLSPQQPGAVTMNPAGFAATLMPGQEYTILAANDTQALPPGIGNAQTLLPAAGDMRTLPSATDGRQGAPATDPEAFFAASGKNWSVATVNDPALHPDAASAAGFAGNVKSQAAADAAAPAQNPFNELTAIPGLSAAHAAVRAAAVEAVSPQDMRLTPQVGTPGWDGALAQKVVWLVGERQQVAELHLNPPHLGPLEVRINVATDQNAVASAQFASPHAAVREALEAALPRLRDILAENGITLSHATVGQDSFRQQQGSTSGDNSPASRHGDEHGGAASFHARPSVPSMRRVSDGMVDIFA